MANTTNGFRRLPALGNTNHNNSWEIKDLSAGVYYWSVQTLDNCFAGSAFAAEGTFGIFGITTESVTNITYNSANCGGEVTHEGGSSVTARGVCWSTSSNPTTADNKTTDGSGLGTFTSSITGLTSGQTYYVRAYATNSENTNYGDNVQFTTTDGLPDVNTSSVTNITTNSASCGGEVTSEDGFTVTARGVCWSTSIDPTTADSKTTDDSGLGAFTSSITGLTSGQTYYVRAYATNSQGTGYGEQKVFTTNMIPPGNALDFDGNGDYVSISDDDQFDLTTNYSFEVWIYPHSFPWLGGLITKYHYAGNGYFLRLTSNSPYTGLDFDQMNTATGILSADEWHHVAAVNNNGERKLYLNGIEQSLTGTPLNVQVNTDPVCIGVDYLPAPRYFDGRVEEVRIWNTARTESEIQNNMFKTLNGDESGLVAYYRADHISGTALSDRTTNDNDGTLSAYMTNDDWVTSTAPVGDDGNIVQTQTQTNIGDAGKQMQVSITSGGDETDYLGIYRTGEGTNNISSGETFPSGVTQRSNIFWGIQEYGSVTADLVFDYSNIPGISNPSAIKLLKRTDATSVWTDVTTQFTHNTGNRTFSGTGFTDFSEYSVGDGGENTLPVTLSSFTA